MSPKSTPKTPASDAARRDTPARTAGGPAISLRAGRANGVTMAATVADRMVHDIVARGWPEGEVLGSESELLERYGVSRAVFREAVRLVEHLEVGRMRRGPGGGLVITAPTVEMVMDAVAVYLFYVDADVEEVFDARMVLEELVTELAPARLGEDEIVELRGLVERERQGDVHDYRELHAMLARSTQNPALEFFVDLLNRISVLFLDDPSVLDRDTIGASAHAHISIAASVLAGDAGLARRRMRKHLEAEAAYLEGLTQHRIGLPRRTDGRKRGQRMAFDVLQEVAAAGWPVGQLLGGETELMERYGVSRAVLREAVRMLEHHQVARMRRGPGGGLFVAQPGAAATTDAVALHLHRLAITPQQLFEVRTAVEIAVLERAVKRLTAGDTVTMEHALEAERAATPEQFPDLGHDLHAVLAGLCGNRVLELLSLVLLQLTRIHQTPKPGTSTQTVTAEVGRVHERIVEAVGAHDLELARLRMRKHMQALTTWVR